MHFSHPFAVFIGLGHFALGQLPVEKIYGVNLGGWLLSEPWMNKPEWVEMGGEICDADCSSCAASEWSLGKKLGQVKTDEVFLKHWQTWFTEADAKKIASLGLNSVRIPLGFWVIDELVDRTSEYFAQGGFLELKRGLRQLKEAGLHILLDMHAMPGVSTPKQMFSGNCTGTTHFYEDSNYQRALTEAGVLAAMAHLDPDWSTVFSIEAINEPFSNPASTPGLQQYYYDYVTVLRVIEYAFGVPCSASLNGAISRISRGPNAKSALASAAVLIPVYVQRSNLTIPGLNQALKVITDAAGTEVIPVVATNLGNRTISTNGSTPSNISSTHPNATAALTPSLPQHNTTLPPATAAPASEPAAVLKARQDDVGGRHYNSHHHARNEAHAHLFKRKGVDHNTSPIQSRGLQINGYPECLTTSAMVKSYQWQGDGATMANVSLGPGAYDNHLYYSYGGIAQANIWSYVQNVCKDGGAAQQAAGNNELPYYTGEWSIATNWNNVSLAQQRAWGDAQRRKFSNSSGWFFWNFRTGEGVTDIDFWSYYKMVDQGVLPKKPDEYFNPDVCLEYLSPWTYPDGPLVVANSTLPLNNPPNGAW